MGQILPVIINNLQQQNTQLIAKIKEKRGNMLIPLFVTPIDRNLVNHVYDIINSQDFIKQRENSANPDNIDIMVDSGGGDADAAYHIAKLLDKNFKGKITYIIPRFAKSAATLLICGGDSIIMGPTSELGPLDPQIKQKSGVYISAKSVQSTLRLIKQHLKERDLELATILASRLEPLILGEYQSSLKIAQEYQKELLKLRMFKGTKKEARIDKIVKFFAEGYTHHSRVIDREEAENKLKLEIEKPDEELWNLIWSLYNNHHQIMSLVSTMRILERFEQSQKD